MKSLLGIVNTEPLKVQTWIKDYCTTNKKKFDILSPHSKSATNFNADVILCLSMQMLRRYMDKLKESNAVVIVFDGVVPLGSANICLLDAFTTNSYRWQLSLLNENIFKARLDLNIKGLESHLDFKDVELLPKMIKSKLGDFSSFVQTLVMLSKEPEQRARTQHILIKHLYSRVFNIDVVVEELLEIVGDKNISMVTNFFQTPVGMDAIRVFGSMYAHVYPPKKAGEGKGKLKMSEIKKIINKKPRAIPYDKVCKGSLITPFDAQYMMKAYNKASSYMETTRVNVKDSHQNMVDIYSTASYVEENLNFIDGAKFEEDF